MERVIFTAGGVIWYAKYAALCFKSKNSSAGKTQLRNGKWTKKLKPL